MPETEKLFTTQQAAELLNMSDSHLRNLIRQGTAQPKTQIGGTWLFAQDEIERLRTRRGRGRPKKRV